MSVFATSARPILVLLGVASAALACARTEPGAHQNGSPQPVAAADAGSPKVYQARGVVRAIDADRRYVNIAHEAVPGYMPAMTMPFNVDRAALLDGVSVGDRVTFTFHEDGDHLLLDSLDRSAPDAGK